MNYYTITKYVGVFLLGIAIFALPKHASAEDSYFFRVDSEINVPLYYGSTGATVRWQCNGSGTGLVTDNTASESVQALDGIIKVASTSAENLTGEAGCDAGEAITGSVSLDGWVTRRFTGTVSDLGSNVTFTVFASSDYTIVVNGVADELGNTLTLNGTTASATYSTTVASQSYSGGKRYIAATVSGGTVKAGTDGYVNVTSSALTVSATASQSVDFGTTDDSSIDADGLAFGHKIRVYESGGDFTNNKILSGTVTAGNSSGTTCTSGGAGNWYCPVPLGNTATTATFAHSSWQTTTTTYTDRSTGADAQTTSDITPAKVPPSGSSSSSSSSTATSTTAPTPTPTPTTEPTSTPTPSPTTTTEPNPSPVSGPSIPNSTVTLSQVGLKEGEVIGATSNDPDVYIVNVFGYKRLFLNPIIFGFYGHLGGFTKIVKTSMATRDILPTSGLFRNCETNSQKVWAVQVTSEDGGTLHHVNMSGESAVAQDPNFFKKVFCINTNEESWYGKSSDSYTSLSQIPLYARR